MIGFINYLFHRDSAKGDLATLLPHRRAMKQADLAWLYPLLHVYCLISEPDLAEGDEYVDTLATVIRDDAIPCDLNLPGNNAGELLCASFCLLLWVLGRHVMSDGNLRSWLHDWLGDSPLASLLPTLQKFLALKSPKPEQKTVKALEAALTNIEPCEQDEWFDGLRRLPSVFLQQRLSSTQRQSPGSLSAAIPSRWPGCCSNSTLLVAVGIFKRQYHDA
ncbi:MAG: hypothetical protein ACI9Y1_002250 [Lentisphaeria bacterium]